LDEAEKRTGLNRKYLIRILNHPVKPGPRKPRKRRATYGAAVVTALVEIWDIFEQPCGQRMEVVLRSELGRLRKLGEVRCSDGVASQLTTISARTIDRVLGREKRIRHLRRNRNPNVQRLIYQKVPVKVAAEWDTSEVGNVQVDFVAHCGRSTGFACSWRKRRVSNRRRRWWRYSGRYWHRTRMLLRATKRRPEPGICRCRTVRSWAAIARSPSLWRCWATLA